MNVSSFYQPHSIATPGTISGASRRTELKTTPGGEGTLASTPDDKISFSNGGSIADLPEGKGLLLTRPDGSQTTLANGRIEANAEKNRMEIHTQQEGPTGVETWVQGFNANGSVSLDRLCAKESENINARMNPQGTITAWGVTWDGQNDYQPEVAQQGETVIFRDDTLRNVDITPAVPMEWLVAN